MDLNWSPIEHGTNCTSKIVPLSKQSEGIGWVDTVSDTTIGSMTALCRFVASEMFSSCTRIPHRCCG